MPLSPKPPGSHKPTGSMQLTHMPFLPRMQAASLLGLGLLYQGSCHRPMTETVFEEMCRAPGVNPHAAPAPGKDGAGGLTGVPGGGGAGGVLDCINSFGGIRTA